MTDDTDIKRLQRHAVTLNTIAYRVGLAVGRTPDRTGQLIYPGDTPLLTIVSDVDVLIDQALAASKTEKVSSIRRSVNMHRIRHAPMRLGEHASTPEGPGVVVGIDFDVLCIRLADGRREWIDDYRVDRLIAEAAEVAEEEIDR